MSERKSLAELVVMPVVVALVGTAGTYFITDQQEKNARTLSEAQLESARELAIADRQIKILEIFSEKITSSDQDDRLLALRLLTALDPNLAEQLAIAVKQGETEDSEVGRVATEVAQNAASRASMSPRLYIHIRSEADRPAAKRLAEGLKARGYLVPGIERLVDRGPSSAQLRYFRQTDEADAREVLSSLHEMGVDVELRHVAGYSNANGYELWFPEGQPRYPSQ